MWCYNCTCIEMYYFGCIGNHSYGMSTLDLLPMLYIVGLRGRYISTIIPYNILYIIPKNIPIFFFLKILFINKYLKIIKYSSILFRKIIQNYSPKLFPKISPQSYIPELLFKIIVPIPENFPQN
jgi:hypothetical protein